MKPKLILIHPFKRSEGLDFAETATFCIPSLSLMQVAGLTPDTWDVKLVDERFDQIDFDEPAHLVGITTYSSIAPRAFEISREFRKRKIPVVIGGIHVSLAPDEAMEHCDSVVIGEAESVWETVLEDRLHGRLKRSYTGERVSMEKLPYPRRDLYADNCIMDVIQTSRGCPFNCSFCSARKFSGAKLRQRPVEEILDELQTIDKKIVYVLDDNFCGSSRESRERVKQICNGIIARKIRKHLLIQTSLNIHDDGEILGLLSKSGVRMAYFGLESVEEENLKEMNKKANLKIGPARIKDAVRSFHEHGIALCGSLIFGNDHDTVQTFDKTLRFVKEANIDTFDVNVLTPFPQTEVHEKMKREDRLFYRDFPNDWKYFDVKNVTFKLKHLTTEELHHGVDYFVSKKTSLVQIAIQFFKTLFATRNFVTAGMILLSNWDNRCQHHVRMKLKQFAPKPAVREEARSSLELVSGDTG